MNHSNAESTTDAGDNLQTPSPTHLPPDVREWLLKQSNEEEIVAELRELRETGGVELSEFIQELRQVLHDNERT